MVAVVLRAAEAFRVTPLTRTHTRLRTQFARYRLVTESYWKNCEEVELRDGEVTTDLVKIAEDRKFTNSLQTKPAEVDLAKQVKVLQYYGKMTGDHPVGKMRIPTIEEI